MPDRREAEAILRQQAERCRRLAASVTDAATVRRLLDLALELEQRADAERAHERDG